MLGDTPAVMTWRRVGSLEHARNFVAEAFDWPLVGEDSHTAMYDAGGILVAFALQWDIPKSATIVEERVQGAIPERIVVDDCCSLVSLLRIDLVADLGSEIHVATTNLERVTRRLAGALNRNAGFEFARPVQPTAATDEGEFLSFLDEAGNYFVLFQPSDRTLGGQMGGKLRALLEPGNGGSRSVARRPAGGGAPVVGLQLMVANLRTARSFYEETLGLRALVSSDREVVYDVGAVTLTLRPEPTVRLVQSLANAGRYLEDWIVFHVEKVERAVEQLAARGVKFPEGIEQSGTGRLAYFLDPDGHPLCVWQPSGKRTNIDFYPALKRLLKVSR